MLCADRVPIVSAHFKSAMTQTGSPDPRIDLVCITLSCPRQFLQNFGTPSSLPGLTSLNCSGFDATSLWHFDAAEQAPSTASLADIATVLSNVRSTPECVAKLFAALRASNNRIQLSGVLNLCCVLMLVLESILLILVVKIVLQHIPLESRHHRQPFAVRYVPEADKLSPISRAYREGPDLNLVG
jgi:hypothetical protein